MPFCSFRGDRWQLHRHLVDTHMDAVTTRSVEGGNMFYEVACPRCDFRSSHRVKPRWRDSSFLQDYRREIALVAFDQLLYHMEVMHG